ncbi:MAG: hypothetical protein FWB87_11545 [Defluviitaleaceae bacterium]|nr:hypothetical protein [Defluviitaleaceae bacterium]
MSIYNEEHDPRSNGPRPEATPPAPPVPPVPPAPPTPPTKGYHYAYTISNTNDLLTRLDAIVNNTAYVHETVNALKGMYESGEMDDGENIQTFVHGMVDIVRAREETNKKAIDLIKEMYQGSNSNASKISDRALHLGIDINQILKDLPPDESIAFTKELLGMQN